MAEVIAFTRVSTQRQAVYGESLTDQLARIEAWAEQNHHTIVGRFSDAGLSGRSMTGRVGIQQAVALTCRKRGRILCVSSLSRVARNVRDCLDIGEKLKSAGASLVSLSEALNTSDANGRLIWSLLASIHAWMAEVGAENTTLVLRSMAARGLRTSGHIPYGHRLNPDGRTLSPDPDEQAVVARIIALRGSGLSWPRIAQQFAEDGTRTRNGKTTWMPKVLAAIHAREVEAQTRQTGAA